MSRQNPPPFGTAFHHLMPLTRFDGKTWQSPKMVPSNKLEMHPAMHVFHYGSSCFEGMKAFRLHDDRIAIFRLDQHIARLQNSARLLNIAVPDAEMARQMIIDVVRSAREEVPDAPGSLYLRPTLMGTDENIGRAGAPSESALLFVLASPVGDYFTLGSPLKLLIERDHARCAPHMGSAKAGGNYASALSWQIKAKAEYGANQVLFCPNGDVQETGASNFMLIDGNKIITKALSSEFLHGITRKSLLELAPTLGFSVEERAIHVDEIKEVIARGGEAILTGTAAVIAPVTAFIDGGVTFEVKSQEKALLLRQAMLAIQSGQAEDKFGWLTVV
ncbi:MAG: branched-chain-amino-acid transaminase [Cardiobacteriaceae bacterium]|nr:branched-chain-amino-acid transaminase [Cardiobacteriaceae bacterium]